MFNIHTHKVTDNETGVAIKTGTKSDCQKYIHAVPGCSGPSPLDEEEFAVANYVLMDNIKEECLQGCRQVNALNPINAAAAYSEVIEMLSEALNQIEYLHGKFKPTGTGENVLARGKTVLEKATKY